MIGARRLPPWWPVRSLRGATVAGRRLERLVSLQLPPLGLARERDRDAAGAEVAAWLNGLDREVVMWWSSRRLAPGSLSLLPASAEGRLPDGAKAAYDRAALALMAAGPLFQRTLHVAESVDGPPADTPSSRSALSAGADAVQALSPNDTADLVRRLLHRPSSAVHLPVRWLDGPGCRSGGRPAVRSGSNGSVAAGCRTWRDLLAPLAVREYPDHLEVDGRPLCVLELCALPRQLESGLTDTLLRQGWECDLAVGVRPLAAEHTIRYLTRRIRDLRAGVVDGDEPDFRQPQAIRDAEALRQALYLGETRLHQVWAVWVVHGSSRDEVATLGHALERQAAQQLLDVRLARYRQRELWAGLFPGQVRRPARLHNLTSDGVACLLPLDSVSPPLDGPWLGVNLLDRSAVCVDRRTAPNPAALYLGSPGSGKSTFAKCEILRHLAGGDDRGILVDPEGEYGAVARHLGGMVLRPAAQDGHGLDPLDLGGATPAERAEHLTDMVAFLDPLLGPLDPAARATLHRALEVAEAGPERPGMKAAVRELRRSASGLALADGLEYLLRGPLAMFCRSPQGGSLARVVAIDLQHVDAGFLPVVAPLLTEYLWRRMNGPPSSRLWITIDEIHLFLTTAPGRRLLVRLFKRARKRGAIVTGITQNVGDLLGTDDGRAIAAAASRVLLFRPGVADADLVADTLSLSGAARARLRRLGVGEALWLEGSRCQPVRTLVASHELPLVDTRPGAVDPSVHPLEEEGGP